MTKKYEREERENERLQKELRQLKEENRHLKKKLKQLNKGYFKFLYAENEEEEQELLEEVKEAAKKICYDCHVGELILVDLGSRYFRKCNNCDKKTKSKPIEELKNL